MTGDYKRSVHYVQTVPTLDVDVVVQGPLPGAADYARARLARLERFTPEPIEHVRVRVTNHTRSRASKSVVAQANLRVGGQRSRAQVEASTSFEAIDALHDKLRCSLQRRRPLRLSQRRRRRFDRRDCGVSTPQHRRNHDRPRVIRRKSLSPARLSVDVAAAQLEDLDYHFHLFTEKLTGLDSVLCRDGSAGYLLIQSRPVESERFSTVSVPLTVSASSPPALTLGVAVERFRTLGHPYLFFIDACTGRGSVLYLRYDGQFGLISPD